jgi:hypothetical protein
MSKSIAVYVGIAVLVTLVVAYVVVSLVTTQWNPAQWKSAACQEPTFNETECWDYWWPTLAKPANLRVRNVTLAVAPQGCSSSGLTMLELKEYTPVTKGYSYSAYQRVSDGKFLARTSPTAAQFVTSDLDTVFADDIDSNRMFMWTLRRHPIPLYETLGMYDMIPGTDEIAYVRYGNLMNSWKDSSEERWNTWYISSADCALDEFVLIQQNSDSALGFHMYYRATTIAPHDPEGLLWHQDAMPVA